MTQQNEFAECDAEFTESKPDCMREYPFNTIDLWEAKREGFRAAWKLQQGKIDALGSRNTDLLEALKWTLTYEAEQNDEAWERVHAAIERATAIQPQRCLVLRSSPKPSSDVEGGA